MNKILNTIINKKIHDSPPIWIMRQAGRYLPEYMEIRNQFDNFLDLCYNPINASEITLQPIKRFDLDAAIIFSDILVIPDAMNHQVSFKKGVGPVLKKFKNINDFNDLKLDNLINYLQPVFENLQLTRSKLDSSKSLIGFSGAPFTIACYMIEGGSSKNFELTRRFSIENQQLFSDLINKLTDAIILYLIEQIKSGADILKVFDSWGGILPKSEFEKWVISPAQKITTAVKGYSKKTPIIYFPKGSGVLYEDFLQDVKIDVLATDQNLSTSYISKNLQEKCLIQGNLDNFLLAYGSKQQIGEAVDDILQKFSKKPFIFNLGHGIIKETPIENVEFLIAKIRNN